MVECCGASGVHVTRKLKITEHIECGTAETGSKKLIRKKNDNK